MISRLTIFALGGVAATVAREPLRKVAKSIVGTAVDLYHEAATEARQESVAAPAPTSTTVPPSL